MLQRDVLDGVAAAYAAGGYARLTVQEIVAVTGPLPPVPTHIRYMEPV